MVLRVVVTLNPASGAVPREIAAAVIAQHARLKGDRRRYAAMLMTDGADGFGVQSAIVDHDRGRGVWSLVEAVIAAADHRTTQDLAPEIATALARRMRGEVPVSDDRPTVPLRDQRPAGSHKGDGTVEFELEPSQALRAIRHLQQHQRTVLVPELERLRTVHQQARELLAAGHAESAAAMLEATAPELHEGDPPVLAGLLTEPVARALARSEIIEALAFLTARHPTPWRAVEQSHLEYWGEHEYDPDDELDEPETPRRRVEREEDSAWVGIVDAHGERTTIGWESRGLMGEHGEPDPAHVAVVQLVNAASDLMPAPAHTASARVRDRLCLLLADAIEADPELIRAAREVMERPTYELDYADDWARLLDAGVEAVTSVLRSPADDPRKTDNPFALLGLIDEGTRLRIINEEHRTR